MRLLLFRLINSYTQAEDQLPSEPSSEDRNKQTDNGHGSCKRARTARIAKTPEKTRQKHDHRDDIRQPVARARSLANRLGEKTAAELLQRT